MEFYDLIQMCKNNLIKPETKHVNTAQLGMVHLLWTKHDAQSFEVVVNSKFGNINHRCKDCGSQSGSVLVVEHYYICPFTKAGKKQTKLMIPIPQ
jgi:hypothetical protein